MDKDKKQKIISTVWSSFKTFLAAKGGDLVEEILKQIFKSQLGGGVKGWIVRKMITVFREEIGEPAVEAILVEAQYSFDKVNGKIIIKRLTDARNSDDVDAYHDVITDLHT